MAPSDPATAACGDVLEATEPQGSFANRRAIFSSPAGVSLYDVERDSVTVVDRTASGVGSRPRFRTPGLVSFVRLREPGDEEHLFGQESLYELSLQTGQATELLRFSDTLHGYDWNPEGSLLAYLVGTKKGPRRTGPHALCLFDPGTGATQQIGSIRRPFGTGVGQREETAVAWSPTGRHILAVETSTEPSLFVVDLEGRHVVPPRDGTNARWMTERRIIFQEDHPRNNEDPGAWLSLSTTTGRTRAFGLPDGFRPALSPDGTMIAFDDGAMEPSVFLYDVEAGTSRRLARGFVAPVWLGARLIAATAAGPCPRNHFCVKPWSVLGTTVGIDPTTRERRPLALPTILNEIHWFGPIDVSLASTGG